MDGGALELPEDIEGILLLNIPSYMGGVNLWASGAARNAPALDEAAPQSFCDGTLEVWSGQLRPVEAFVGCPPPLARGEEQSGSVRMLTVLCEGELVMSPECTALVPGPAAVLRTIEPVA